MLGIKNTVTEMNNAIDGLISSLYMASERSLKKYQELEPTELKKKQNKN